VASPSDCVAALREDFLKLKVGGFSSPSVGRRHSEKKIFFKKKSNFFHECCARGRVFL
jgi:hypothetical protein